MGVALLVAVFVLAGCDSDATAGGGTSTTAVSTPPPAEPETTTTGVEPSTVVLPPEECVAQPVTEHMGDTIVALGLCGGPPLFDNVLYPIAPADTVRDALQLLVDGTGEALLRDGVWTGFDRIPQETRQQLNVETELDSTGELTITIDLDGEPWQPPVELRSGPTDHSFFSIPILWTAFSDPAVERVTDPICLVPSGNLEQEICPDSFRLEFEEFVESQWQIDAGCTYTWWRDEACRDDG